LRFFRNKPRLPGAGESHRFRPVKVKEYAWNTCFNHTSIYSSGWIYCSILFLAGANSYAMAIILVGTGGISFWWIEIKTENSTNKESALNNILTQVRANQASKPEWKRLITDRCMKRIALAVQLLGLSVL